MELTYYDNNLHGIILRADSLKNPLKEDHCVMEFNQLEDVITGMRNYLENTAISFFGEKAPSRFSLTKKGSTTVFGVSAKTFNISLEEGAIYDDVGSSEIVGRNYVYLLVVSKTLDELAGLNKEIIRACPGIGKFKMKDALTSETFERFLDHYHALFYGPENKGDITMFERD